MLLLLVGLTALFAAGAFAIWRASGWNWMAVFLAGAALILGMGGIAETLLLRIELTDDAIVITDLRGRRRYAIADIERIEEAKGVPPAIRLKDGRWVKLPSLAANLGNSVRAWLKA